MKKFILLFTITLTSILSNAQENLVPNGDFEYYSPGIIDNIDIFNFNGVTRNNPKIPCRSGLFETGPSIGDPTVSSSFIPFWHGFGVSQTGGESFAASLFDSRADCDNPLNVGCSLTEACDEILQHKADVGIPENYYATNYNQSRISQYHRIPIDFNTLESDHPVIGRYVGITKQGIRRPGIYCKLKKPLKCGYVYTLSFRAVKKSGNYSDDRLNIRLCTNDDWNDYAYLDGDENKKEIDITVSEDGGPNHDQWELITVQFYVEQTNVQYLYIRGSGHGTDKILIDEIEILDQCEVEFACDRTVDNGEVDLHVNQNYFHGPVQPLTFYNTEYQKHFRLEIYTALGQLIRVIVIDYPGPGIAWDGKDQNGNEVANGNYIFKVKYGAACVCKEWVSNFVKIGTPPGCFDEIYWAIDPVYGALTFYNLQNVSNFSVIIYSSDGANIVAGFHVNSPSENIISWDGTINQNDPNSPTVIPIPPGEWCDHPTDFRFTVVFNNECCTHRLEKIPFTQICFDAPNFLGPQFSFKPGEKEIECGFFYNYDSYNIAPTPCCANNQDLFIEDVTLYGNQEFKLTRDIQAGPKVLVTSNSNILFQAGREIRLVNGFTAEIGSDFLATIDPTCGRMMSEIGPVIETINWNQYPEESNYKSPLIVLDSTINLNVYPNPTSNDLFVQSELGIKMVEVFDLTGKSISYEYFSESKLVKIEASTLLNGIYILQITLENGSVEIRKVIKN